MLSRGLQPVGARVPEEEACLFSHERRRVWAQEATLAKHDEAIAFHLNYTQTLNTGAPPIRGSMPPHRAFRVA